MTEIQNLAILSVSSRFRLVRISLVSVLNKFSIHVKSLSRVVLRVTLAERERVFHSDLPQFSKLIINIKY